MKRRLYWNLLTFTIALSLSSMVCAFAEAAVLR